MSRKGLWAIHIITTILLTLAVAFAAWHIKISYDESLSYYVLKTNDIKRMLGLANTHWLNSFFMKLSMLTIGDNVFSFRIASMIAFPFYATGLFKLSLQLKNNWLALACYVLLIFNPYTLQFFSLARGYGMAMAFQAWLLYYIIIIKNEKSVKAWYKICLLCALMLLANLTYLYTVFGVFGLFLLQIITLQKNYEWNTNTRKIIALFTLIIVAASVALMICRYAGDLWFGGQDFVASIFGSFWHRYAYYGTDILALRPILNTLTLVLISVSSGYFIYHFWTTRRFTAGTILASIILAILGLNIFFHHAFGTPYLLKRTTLQWWTPVIVLVCFFIENLKLFSKYLIRFSLNQQQVFSVFFSLTFSLLVMLHFAYQYYGNYENRIERHRYDIPIYNDLYNKKVNHVGMSRHFCVPLKNYYQFIEPRYLQLSFDFIYEKVLANCDDEEAWNKIVSYDHLVISESQTVNCMKQRNINFEIIKTYGKHHLIHLK